MSLNGWWVSSLAFEPWRLIRTGNGSMTAERDLYNFEGESNPNSNPFFGLFSTFIFCLIYFSGNSSENSQSSFESLAFSLIRFPSSSSKVGGFSS